MTEYLGDKCWLHETHQLDLLTQALNESAIPLGYGHSEGDDSEKAYNEVVTPDYNRFKLKTRKFPMMTLLILCLQYDQLPLTLLMLRP